MNRSGMEIRNTRASPSGNSGTSFPQSFPWQVSVGSPDDVDVWTVVGAVDDVESVVCCVCPPSLEVVDSVEEELKAVVEPVLVCVTSGPDV